MSIGKITEFKVGEGNWTNYIARFEQYFLVNKIESTFKVNTLLAVVGEETFDLMVDLCNPVKPEEKTFTQLVKIVKDHVQPEPSKRAERFKLRQRKQSAEENLASYLAALKKLARSCEFGEQLEDHLTDQFLYGMKNDSIRQRLFAEKDLNLAKAVHIALSMEAAEQNSHMVEVASSSGTIHKMAVKNPQEMTGRSNCRHCGKCNHQEHRCFFKNARCHSCGAVGHISGVCKGNKNTKIKFEGKRKFSKTHNIVLSEEEVDHVDLHSSQEIYKINVGNEKPLKIQIMINNVPVYMEIDTGSAVSVIPEFLYYSKFSKCQLRASTLRLKSYTDDPIEILGFIKVNCSVNNICHTANLFILKGQGPPLIGRDWVKAFNISVDNLFHIRDVDFSMKVSNLLLSKFPNIFNNELGCFKGEAAKLYVKTGVTPIFLKARSLPLALREKVETEIDKLVELKVLAPIEFSEWATPIVPVLKKMETSAFAETLK